MLLQLSSCDKKSLARIPLLVKREENATGFGSEFGVTFAGGMQLLCDTQWFNLQFFCRAVFAQLEASCSLQEPLVVEN